MCGPVGFARRVALRDTPPMDARGPARIRLSRVIGGLSYALDLTEGEPPGHAVRSCVIGMRIADELGLDAATRSRLFYALLMKDAGCSANSAKMAALFGADDHEAKRTAKRSNWSRAFPAFVWSLRIVAPEGSFRARAARLRAIKEEGQVTRSLMLARCDRGAEIALLLGLEPETAEGIRALDEHWDGNGQPFGLRGEEIPLLARIVCLAQTAEIFHGEGGPDAACAIAARRSGEWFDPALVQALHACRDDATFWASLARPDVSAWEPEDRLLTADDAHLDRIATAFAGVIDVKSPWTYRHSDLVADARGPDRRRARRRRGRGDRPAPRRDAPRHRQARGLQPRARQVRPAHRRRGRPGARAPADHRAHPRADPGLRPPRAASPPRITSGSTAAATPTACAARTSPGRCACSPSPTSSRR